LPNGIVLSTTFEDLVAVGFGPAGRQGGSEPVRFYFYAGVARRLSRFPAHAHPFGSLNRVHSAQTQKMEEQFQEAEPKPTLMSLQLQP
jgi:hypothetical protein